jgi:hypothetical protein
MIQPRPPCLTTYGNSLRRRSSSTRLSARNQTPIRLCLEAGIPSETGLSRWLRRKKGAKELLLRCSARLNCGAWNTEGQMVSPATRTLNARNFFRYSKANLDMTNPVLAVIFVEPKTKSRHRHPLTVPPTFGLRAGASVIAPGRGFERAVTGRVCAGHPVRTGGPLRQIFPHRRTPVHLRRDLGACGSRSSRQDSPSSWVGPEPTNA